MKVTILLLIGFGLLMNQLAPLYRPAASYTMMHAYQQGKPMPPAFWPK